jgi:Ca-activated chloride channel family protein
MKRTLILLGLLLLHTPGARAEADPRRILTLGAAAYEKGDYPLAASNFTIAAEGATKAGLDPAVPFYNRGAALLKAGQAAPAAEQFQAAARTTDLDLQQRALFNRGNALFQTAGELEQATQTQPALQAMEEALAMYEQAMALRPQDADPKVNYELATREKKRLEELVQQQQQQQQDQKDQKKDEEKKEEEKNDQDKKEQKQDQQDPSDQSGAGEKPEPSKPNEQQQQDGSNQQKEQEEKNAPGSEMTREEAGQLLDAMKEQEQANREQMARDRMRANMGHLPPVSKDW